jgi:preprotein translocase subunit Sec61beta
VLSQKRPEAPTSGLLSFQEEKEIYIKIERSKREVN